MNSVLVTFITYKQNNKQSWEILYCVYREQCLIKKCRLVNLNLISRLVLLPSQGLKGVLIRGGGTEINRINIDPQIQLCSQWISRSRDPKYPTQSFPVETI